MREEEMKKALNEKKKVIFDRNQINIHTMSYDDNAEEIKEMRDVIDNDLKSPTLKRRSTVQNFI